MRVQCTCSRCGVSFTRIPSQASRAVEAYCSRACYHAARRARGLTAYVCDHCGETYQGGPTGARLYTRHFCSKECRAKGQVGSNHPHWKSGRILHPNGYVRITLPDGGTVWEHRQVMEEHLGHPLKPDEVIHHVNGDRADNRLDNLRVMTAADHARLHHLGRKRSIG